METSACGAAHRRWERDTSGSGPLYSFRTSAGSPLGIGGSDEVEEEATRAAENRVFVAVGDDVRHGTSAVLWALLNLAKDGAAQVVLAHVCSPPAHIPPSDGTKVHYTKAHMLDLNHPRNKLRIEAFGKLDVYVTMCTMLKVNCEKELIWNEDVAKGLEQLMARGDVTKLVMGAGDKHYSKIMKTPKSKTSLKLMEAGPLSCKIWFTCTGQLICTRGANTTVPEIPPSPLHTVESTSSANSITSHMRAMPIQLLKSEASSSNGNPRRDMDRFRTEVTQHLMHEPSVKISSHPSHEVEKNGIDELYAKIEEALNESYQEATKRRKAARDMLQILHKARDLEKLYHSEMRHRKANEETLARQTHEINETRIQRDRIYDELCDAKAQTVMLEQSMTEMKSALKDHQEKLVASNLLLKDLQAGKEKLQQERNAAVTEAEELRQKNERISMPTEAVNTEFSPFEIEHATQHFDKTLEIGKEGLGNVYKGWVHNTTVAIKFRHPQSMQGQSEFNQEVAFLSRVRHPNLVMLIGSCRDTLALVYEFLPNGSLEDRMACKNNTAPLTWQARTRIISEICSTLTFLHSNKPHPVVHGNLKPANILFDANFVTKLGDFGIGQFLTQSNTFTTRLHRKTTPKYTGSDMYSFGIIILHLLTGQPPHNIDKFVKDAIEKKKLHSVIDPCAGSWPFVQANQLAHLGLRCTEMSMKRRPALAEDLWMVIEPLAKAASLTAWRPSLAASSDDASTPSDFLCPILLEAMSDPHIAADGYTYEAEAIRGWLDGGNDTSPMTNLRLAHHELTPNLSLRSVILEWQEVQQQKAAAQGQGMTTA